MTGQNSFALAILLLISFHSSAGLEAYNLTFINDHRDFRPLYLGDDMDYFISNKVANIKDADSVCKSIGPKYHLMTLENEVEYRKLLPYLRSLEIDRVWTSGVKLLTTANTSKLEWTSPTPGSAMDFINFPSSSNLTRQITSYDGPRCRGGFLTPKCSPGTCNVTLEDCNTITPPCTITNEKDCTTTRPDCSATCNNCTIEDPVCFIVQKPCEVTSEPCKTIKPPCKITTPKCVTVRPPCITVIPPCEPPAPQPCTTTQRPPCSTTERVCVTTQPKCKGSICPPPTTTCRPPTINCQPKPEICYPDAVICPTPVVVCPPEETVCSPPELDCPQPLVDCPLPNVYCPPPSTVCTPAKVNCEAPEVNCPGVVINCPSPTFTCPGPVVECPPPKVVCDEPVPCEYPIPPIPCPCIDDTCRDFYGEEDTDSALPSPTSTENDLECDDCKSTGCIALRKDTDFRYRLEECSSQFHFICEGNA